MPAVPNFMERTLLLNLNLGPGPLVDLVGALSFKALAVAVKLGVFDALSGEPLTVAETARRINASERGAGLLLHALESTGYVQKQGDRYANTPIAAKWMARSSANSIADAFTYFEDVLDRWDHLDESIRRGAPPITAWEWFDQHPGGWEKYNLGMIATANMAGGEIIAKVKLPPTARRLLDVGGGHGWHSINFCRKHPGLTATVLDWPQAIAVARKIIAAEKIGDRVSVREGDFWKDDLGNGYDAALLFNIVHMYQPDKNKDLFRKVAGALNPGGTIVILDQMAVKASGPMAKAMAGLIGLELFNAVNGQTYPPADVAGWLAATGFNNSHWMSLQTVPGFALVAGTKGGDAQ